MISFNKIQSEFQSSSFGFKRQATKITPSKDKQMNLLIKRYASVLSTIQKSADYRQNIGDNLNRNMIIDDLFSYLSLLYVINFIRQQFISIHTFPVDDYTR